jgi:hypothetical protein
MQTRAPHRAEPISTRLDRGGGMDAPPTSAQEHFARWALVEIPTCCLKRSPGEGRLLGDGERGEEIISRSSSSAPEDHDSDGVSSPRALAAARAALLSCLLCFLTHCLSLSARLASHLATCSGKVTPAWVAMHTPKTLCINTTDIRKGRSWHKLSGNQLEWTHPGDDDPFP